MPRAKKQPDAWRNRIVGYGKKPANQFLAHPDNWRQHPPDQREKFIAIMKAVGWVQNVIENVRTGHVIDGHLRIEETLTRNEHEEIPYTQVDISEAEEMLILATFDPISALAKTADEKLGEVLRLIPNELSGIATAVHANRQAASTIVSFEATVHYRVVVECADADVQHALAERLATEGFRVRTTGGDA